MSSMMAPTITRQVNGALLATVSNGSRQIRKAILLLLINVIGYGMDKESAIHATCVYVEDSGICIEGGLPDRVIETVTPHLSRHQAARSGIVLWLDPLSDCSRSWSTQFWGLKSWRY